ncbi:hypothetical protein NKG94_03555 [Micromonospora sp. M12]
MLRIDPFRPDAGGAVGLADVLTVEFGIFDDDPAAVLTACLRRAVARTGVGAADIWAMSSGAPGGELAEVEEQALAAVFGDAAAVRVPALFGDTGPQRFRSRSSPRSHSPRTRRTRPGESPSSPRSTWTVRPAAPCYDSAEPASTRTESSRRLPTAGCLVSATARDRPWSPNDGDE